ncbi:thiamine ABC transporter substrate binding subunit [Cucumibacter marinus]|uniref:thiamine ABC transporter substrate binding subunit n=1 Tax=Cucumibacter marinus TaxID=1121252 RepID=UPI00041CD533|nr:thiamine ABC transporter substrate binding subunit [Cucumibacter marinus]
MTKTNRRFPARHLALLPAILTGAIMAQPALAQDQPVLTVYTYDAFAADWGPAAPLKQGFEKTCECTISFVGADSSIGALRKVQLEGEATPADIVLGLDTSIAGEALKTGLFAPHGLDLTSLDLPIDYQSPDFVPFDYGYFAFVYNAEEMPNPPGSFEELAKDDPDLKIVIQDPRSSTPGLGLVLWVKAAYGDEANQAWNEIGPHIVTVTKDWSESYSLFLDGEADMVLSYTTSPAYHLIAEQDDRFKAATFEEGHYVQLELAGILNSSPNKDLAREFMAYLTSPEGQAAIPTTNWMFPVTTPAGGLPEGFPKPLPAEDALMLPDDVVDAQADAYIDEFLASIR